MSFRTLFSKVVHVVAHAAPIVGEDAIKVVGVADTFLPLLGPEGVAIEAILNKGVDFAESAIQVEQQGAAKKQTAAAIITAELTNAEPILQSLGLPKNFQPSPATVGAISSAIEAAVAARNATANLLETLKAEPATAGTKAA